MTSHSDDPRLVSRLASLTEHAPFLALQEAAGKKRDAVERTLIGDHLRSEKPVDQRQFDYWRGFLDGVDYVLREPQKMLRLEEKLRGSGNAGQPERR